jgi:acetylornithine deacetylase/succinyl-diaminopimelate desuccinylase-like protein
VIGDLVTAAHGQLAREELIEHLRALIRFPSVSGDEIEVARHVADVLDVAGIPAEVFEPEPKRGSVVARLRGDGTGGGPLLLMSHLDVVPAPPERWTHDPFGAEIADGYVWGRGAIDMKHMVALELEVMLLLARATHAAGRHPESDPVPGLRRDIIFATTADEEVGGDAGMGWLVDHRPELVRADAAFNEDGAFTVEAFGRRLYPIQAGEKGYGWYRVDVEGVWSHGSMPGDWNAAVRAARVVDRLATPGDIRLIPAVRHAMAALESIADRNGTDRDGDDGQSEDADPADFAALWDPPYDRFWSALLRDTVSPNILKAGTAQNVIPGAAQIELDCRVLPGTRPSDMMADLVRRIGDDLTPYTTVHELRWAHGIDQPLEGPAWDAMRGALLAADPEGVIVPILAPWSTDAKHTARIDVPTFGFSPLRLGPHDGFLDIAHADDERCPIEGLQWGLGVFADAIERFCG